MIQKWILFSCVLILTSCAHKDLTIKTNRQSPATTQKEKRPVPNKNNNNPSNVVVAVPQNTNPESIYQSAQVDIQNKNYQSAIQKLNIIPAQFPKHPLSEKVNAEIVPLKVQEAESRADHISALQIMNQANNNQQYKNKMIEVVDQNMSVEQLETVLDDSTLKEIHAHALLKMGEFSIEEKENQQARKYFMQILEDYPGSELNSKAQDYIAQIDAYSKVSSQTIGVILPLSGKHAQVAQKTLRAIQMGLGLNSSIPSKFKLAVIDSEGNADTARRGVDRLVQEDNVIAIIGSILSKNATAVSTRANELGVPNIALSQKGGVTDVGPYVYRNALTSEMQVHYLVKTAMEDLGMKKFAVLFPNDAYGTEYANIFWDEVLARGGQVTAIQPYSNKETDFRQPIQRLVGTFYIEARADEYRYYAAEKSKAQKTIKKSIREEEKDDVLPPITDFDAIFIPDSIKALGQISAMLSFSGVRNMKLLGTNIWDTPAVIRRVGNMGENIIFVDSLNFSDIKNSNNYFVQEYRKIYNEEPGLVELQAYDSATLLREIITKGSSSREAVNTQLTQLNKLTPSREIIRPMSAFTIQNGNVVPLKK